MKQEPKEYSESEKKVRSRVEQLSIIQPSFVDSEEEDEDAEETAVQEGEEIWPPVNYDPIAPVSLPQGPRTVAIQNLLTQGVSFPNNWFLLIDT